MNEFSPGEEINSWLEEIRQSSTDWVGSTEISNFESSGWASTEGVAGYLHETIPPTHLEGCSHIQYQPNPSELYPNARGTFDSQSREINVWTPSQQLQGMENTVEPLTHQVGYNAYENIRTYRPDIAERWSEVHDQSSRQYEQDSSGFVSNRAITDKCEDFAETYTNYIHDPVKLKSHSQEKYEFMKQEIFSGREYSPSTLGKLTYNYASNQISFGSGIYEFADKLGEKMPLLFEQVGKILQNPKGVEAIQDLFGLVNPTIEQVCKISAEKPENFQALKKLLAQY